MKRKIPALAFILVTVLATILSACGGTAEESAPVTTAATSAPTTTAAAPATTAGAPTTAPAKTTAVPATTAAGAPIYGGTLTIDVNNGNFMSFDQAKFTWQMSGWLSFFQESFLEGDFNRGPSGTNEYPFISSDMIPDVYATSSLAESFEQPDALTIIFHIRKGINWQNKPPVNGRAFTADDAVYSMNRTIAARMPRHDFVKSVTSTDKYTVVIKLNRPEAFWQYELAWGPYFLMYPKEMVDAGMEDWRNVVGTGAFIIKDYVADSMVTLGKNPDYWGTWKNPKDGKEYKLPFVDKLQIPFMPDEATWIAAVQTGKVDIGSFSPKWKTQVPKAAPQLTIKEIPSIGANCLFFKWGKPPVDNVLVRRALCMAIDRKAINDTFCFSTGNYQSPNTPLNPNDGPSLYPSWEEFGQDVKDMYTYNPDKAKALLTQAGYPNGFDGGSIVCNPTISGGGITDALVIVQSNWAKIGVKVTIEPIDNATFNSRKFAKDYNLFMVDTKSSTPRYFNEFTINNMANNTGGVTYQKYEDAWLEIKSTMDGVKRAALSKALMIDLWRQAPFFDIPYSSYYRCWWPWVHNFNGEQYLGFHHREYFKYIWVDKH